MKRERAGNGKSKTTIRKKRHEREEKEQEPEI